MFTTSTNCICHRRAGQGRSPAPIKHLSNVELTPRSSSPNFNDTRDPFPKPDRLSTLPKIITDLEYSQSAELDSPSVTPFIPPLDGWDTPVDEMLPYRKLFNCIVTICMR
jgi:hypothetical protein